MQLLLQAVVEYQNILLFSLPLFTSAKTLFIIAAVKAKKPGCYELEKHCSPNLSVRLT